MTQDWIVHYDYYSNETQKFDICGDSQRFVYYLLIIHLLFAFHLFIV